MGFTSRSGRNEIYCPPRAPLVLICWCPTNPKLVDSPTNTYTEWTLLQCLAILTRLAVIINWGIIPTNAYTAWLFRKCPLYSTHPATEYWSLSGEHCDCIYNRYRWVQDYYKYYSAKYINQSQMIPDHFKPKWSHPTKSKSAPRVPVEQRVLDTSSE